MSRSFVRLNLLASEEKEVRKEERVIIRELRDPFLLPLDEFVRNYKVSMEMVHYLCSELQEDLAPQSSTGYPVSLKVISSLKMLLDGHYQRGNANEASQCIGQTTVSKYLNQFVTAVNARLKYQWLNFPGTPRERNQISENFLLKSGVPNILGAIDCTHVKIFPPNGLTNSQYRNRYGDMTINVQLICDADAKILNVNANFPGSCHDQYIFNNSLVKVELQRLYNERTGQYFLLGDSGYALEPWMMTPITNTVVDSPEDRYTSWHCSTRNVIERTNGYLKGTFRCLGIDRRLHYSPEKASAIIYACCTLYNIMKHFRIPPTASEVEAEEETPHLPQALHETLLRVAQQKRQNLIQNHFM
ncbi:unnamed protein product [Chilo suppressalis]|uniref:DDE Tnp4 domain-containing protein n=1 Tax=Chilo suppressalis TaxID=168631 RepID=A0ABN8B8J8_CHISP|nr:unnamed protein product [Chilo suppressalis]